MSQSLAEQRKSLYKNPEVVRLIARVIQLKEGLKPEYDLKHGFRYPEAEQAVGKDPEETKSLLRKLVELGVLREEFAWMSLQCPSCGSANISTTYSCPFCGSPRISRNALIEHIACGYIGNISEFRRDGGLVCPRCRGTLRRGDYRVVGTWYECVGCGKRLELLKVGHECRECGEKFLFDDARYTEVYTYFINQNILSELRMDILFSTLIRDLLADLEAKLRVPAVVKGRSGASHRFDVMIEMPGGRRAVVDALVSLTPIGSSQILTEYGKIVDTQIDAYIIASPSLDEDAKKLAASYGLKVFEGEISEAIKKLKDYIRKG